MVQFQTAMESISDDCDITLLPTLTVTDELEGGKDLQELLHHQESLDSAAQKKCVVKLDGARYTIGN